MLKGGGMKCVGIGLAFVLLAVAWRPLVGSPAGAQSAKVQSVYLIGNSLTWDTVPSKLDFDVQWHVDCGKSLPYIHANPEKPCVKSSTLWPKALKEKPYHVLVFQPHYGTSLKQDAATVSKWMALQPRARIVLHTGWAFSKTRAKEYASTDISKDMVHSPAYFEALIAALEKKHPKRPIGRTHAMDLLARIAADIKAGKAPFEKIEDLYRDSIHMTHGEGRYLMHNAMRHALGQPFSSKGFEKIDPGKKAYLDGLLAALKRS